MRLVFASSCMGFGIVLRSPVSGMEPGSKAIEAILLPERLNLLSSSNAYSIVQSFDVE